MKINRATEQQEFLKQIQERMGVFRMRSTRCSSVDCLLKGATLPKQSGDRVISVFGGEGEIVGNDVVWDRSKERDVNTWEPKSDELLIKKLQLASLTDNELRCIEAVYCPEQDADYLYKGKFIRMIKQKVYGCIDCYYMHPRHWFCKSCFSCLYHHTNTSWRCECGTQNEEIK